MKTSDLSFVFLIVSDFFDPNLRLKPAQAEDHFNNPVQF